MTARQCGECTLCCKLLPMSKDSGGRSDAARLVAAGLLDASIAAGMLADFDKPAGWRCPFQRFRGGCTVYKRRPFGCRVWSCAWLQGADLPRPDRVHYVVDENPDFVHTEKETVPVVQVWIDPNFPTAHRDPELRAFLLRVWEEKGAAALIRFNENDAILLYHDESGWHERTTLQRRDEHTAEEKHAAGLGFSREEALTRLERIK